MKKSSGFGPEGIGSYFVKTAFPVISVSLQYFQPLNYYRENSCWKTARVSPIFMSGEHDDRSKYRPISVLPVVSRLFENLTYDQLYNHLDQNKYVRMHQSSFRALHSVVTCLFKYTSDWYINIDNSKINANIFIDLKKSFDTVGHDILLAKTHHYDINGIEHYLLRSYLNNSQQICNFNASPLKFKL